MGLIRFDPKKGGKDRPSSTVKRDTYNLVIMHFRLGAAANCELGRLQSGNAMNDNDHNILDVWLSGEGTVRATNAVSSPDEHRHADARRLSIIISGSIDTNSHPWAKTFKKIDVTLYFSDEIPADDACAFLSASEICLEGNDVYRDSLDIEAFLPTASFTMVS